MSIHYRTVYFIVKIPILLGVGILFAAFVYSAISQAAIENLIALSVVICFLLLVLTFHEIKFKRVFVQPNEIVIRDLFFRSTVLKTKDVRLEEVRSRFFGDIGPAKFKLIDQTGKEYVFLVNKWEYTENKLRKVIFG